MKSIKMKMTWRGVVPIIVAGIESANEKGRSIAIDELYRLADIADSIKQN